MRNNVDVAKALDRSLDMLGEPSKKALLSTSHTLLKFRSTGKAARLKRSRER
jgi:hypothetical protein